MTFQNFIFCVLLICWLILLGAGCYVFFFLKELALAEFLLLSFTTILMLWLSWQDVRHCRVNPISMAIFWMILLLNITVSMGYSMIMYGILHLLLALLVFDLYTNTANRILIKTASHQGSISLFGVNIYLLWHLCILCFANGLHSWVWSVIGVILTSIILLLLSYSSLKASIPVVFINYLSNYFIQFVILILFLILFIFFTWRLDVALNAFVFVVGLFCIICIIEFVLPHLETYIISSPPDNINNNIINNSLLGGADTLFIAGIAGHIGIFAALFVVGLALGLFLILAGIFRLYTRFVLSNGSLDVSIPQKIPFIPLLSMSCFLFYIFYLLNMCFGLFGKAL